jgi:hypothetical protein
LFENKQNQILEDAVTTGVLRQPDQDDHAFEHYLHDINSATEPVMNEVNSHRRQYSRPRYGLSN